MHHSPVGVHEIHTVTLPHARQQIAGSPLVQRVPSDVRDWQAPIHIKVLHPPRDYPKPLAAPRLIAALKKQLQAEADAKEGLPAL